MTDVGYVLSGWAITFAVMGTYAWLVIRRGKRLAEVVPAEERRWSSPEADTPAHRSPAP